MVRIKKFSYFLISWIQFKWTSVEVMLPQAALIKHNVPGVLELVVEVNGFLMVEFYKQLGMFFVGCQSIDI